MTTCGAVYTFAPYRSVCYPQGPETTRVVLRTRQCLLRWSPEHLWNTCGQRDALVHACYAEVCREIKVCVRG